MPREISDEEYNWLQNRRQVADLADSLWNDPILGREAKALLKKKMPNVQIPDHDIRAEVQEEFRVRDQRDHEAREAFRVAQEDAYWKNERDRVKKENNYNDDEIKDLEKFMVENNVGSYEVASAYRKSKMPKPSEPTTVRDPFWNIGKSDTFKEIAKDPEAWGQGELMKVLNKQQNQGTF